MGTLVDQIAQKYQGSAPQRVISAIHAAAKRTGADFSLLMEKASAESSFNPSAKAKTSSATGLFQFIDSTWLSMVKEHGHKYGLGAYAKQIEMKNGKPCVDNCDVKQAILNLRKSPEISALMAGELTAGNKEYLENHTKGDVGKTEMYLAHFLGAGGAAKFINRRDANGDMTAAAAFPREARANKSVFYDRAGKARSLDDVYNIMARKMGDTTNTQIAKNDTANGTAGSPPPARSATTAPAHVAASLLLSDGGMPPMSAVATAQALPSSTDNAAAYGSIAWNTPRTEAVTGFTNAPGSILSSGKLSAESVMVLAALHDSMTQQTLRTKDQKGDDDKPRYNA